MDFAGRYRQKQIAVWVLVGTTAVLANLPDDLASRLNLQTEFMLGVLGLLGLLAMFFFARFSYFLLTMLLIVGANLPDRWSAGLQIDKMPLIIALAVMVVGSLINQASKIVPSGLEPPPKKKIPDGIKALMAAIPRGQERSVRMIIAMNIDLNCLDDSGQSPLMAAAKAGNTNIIELLIKGGARVELKSQDGLTAVDYAQRAGHTEIAGHLQRIASAVTDTTPALTRAIQAPSIAPSRM